MKKCDYFKDLILTDYMDGQLDNSSSKDVENHLIECCECRAFFKNAKVATALPFERLTPQPPPSELWSNIKQRIENEGQESSPLEEIVSKLKGLFVFPRVVPVFASLILMMAAGAVTVNTIQIQQAKEQAQGEYLVALLAPTSSTTSDSGDLGTPIEHYFL